MDTTDAVQSIKDISIGEVSVKATITQLHSHRIRNGNLMIEAVISDSTGSTRCVWFSKYLKSDLKRGSEYIFKGKYELKYGRLALQKPSYKPTGEHPSVEYLANAPFESPKKSYPSYGSKKNSFDWGALGAGAFWLTVIIGGIVLFSHHTPSNPNPSPPSSTAPSATNSSTTDGTGDTSSPTYTTPTTTNDTATQSYWYCWDTGNPSPHHLGYHVSGDHYCTDQELHDAGFAGY